MLEGNRRVKETKCYGLILTITFHKSQISRLVMCLVVPRRVFGSVTWHMWGI